jgi:hypothetical protein
MRFTAAVTHEGTFPEGLEPPIIATVELSAWAQRSRSSPGPTWSAGLSREEFVAPL